MKKFSNKKSQKGITGVDLSIAIIVIIVFTGVIANLLYNSYRLSLEIKKRAVADSYITTILEKVDEKSFEDVSNSNFVSNLNDVSIDSAYTVNYNVSDYGNGYNINGNPVFKKVTLTISYNNGENKITVNKLKVREIGE